MNDQLIIHGARENNLKNVDLTIPGTSGGVHWLVRVRQVLPWP